MATDNIIRSFADVSIKTDVVALIEILTAKPEGLTGGIKSLLIKGNLKWQPLASNS